MFVSCIPIGAHYIVDLVAGAAIAYVALVGARRVAASVGPRADEDIAISLDVLLGRLPWLGGIFRRR
jgi:membrane-associated phospholipid phosphatase